MKRSKFSEAQIAFVLKQAEDGTTIGEVCRKAGISDATFYAWRRKKDGRTPKNRRCYASQSSMAVTSSCAFR